MLENYRILVSLGKNVFLQNWASTHKGIIVIWGVSICSVWRNVSCLCQSNRLIFVSWQWMALLLICVGSFSFPVRCMHVLINFSLAYCKPPLPQWSNNWMWVLRYLQHDQIWFLFIYAGLCFSKPSVILLLEQGKEPWMAKREMTKDLCSGEWRGNRHAKTFAGYSPACLKGSTSSLCCWHVPLKCSRS